MRYRTVPDALRAVRRRRGWSQRALAKAAGVHQSQIQRYETGRTVPNADRLRGLAGALQVEPGLLFGLTCAALRTLQPFAPPDGVCPHCGQPQEPHQEGNLA